MQKAVQDNHESKRHKQRAPTSSLLRKQSQKQSKETMAELAAEAAATAAARTNQIRQETRKISEGKAVQQEVAEVEQPKGEVISSPEEEMHDIREKGVHRMNLKKRLPWLKDLASVKKTTTGRQPVEGESGTPREVVSPDSGVTEEDLENGGLSSKHTHSDPNTVVQQALSRHSSTDEIPVHLQNGETLPELPPKDYPKQLTPEDHSITQGQRQPLTHHQNHQNTLPELPPKDYPKQKSPEDYPKAKGGQSHMAGGGYQNDLLADNDYYALMMSGIVN